LVSVLVGITVLASFIELAVIFWLTEVISVFDVLGSSGVVCASRGDIGDVDSVDLSKELLYEFVVIA
jgi:hypothetical protein